jgi:hypothetical protein
MFFPSFSTTRAGYPLPVRPSPEKRQSGAKTILQAQNSKRINIKGMCVRILDKGYIADFKNRLDLGSASKSVIYYLEK